jgi:hypothetical protein
MKTKDIFNFNRFGKYFVSDLKTCAANYGLSLLVTALLLPLALYCITVGFNALMSGIWDGPDMWLRATCFLIAMVCIVVQMPVKCYGRITEKQYGSFWLTLPASRLEKFVSMFLMTCIIVPVIGVGCFIGLDAIICALDPTCGGSLVTGVSEVFTKILASGEITVNLANEGVPVEDVEMINEIMTQVTSPWLYIDEIFGITLPFLMGAVFFKSGKTVKTFMALFAFSTAVSIISTPFMTRLAADMMNGVNNGDVMRIFENGIFRNLVLIDTISDAIVNIALIIGIWFRIKTLKH